MIDIRIKDMLFAHADYSTDFQKSKFIKWDRNINDNNLCIYTDSHIQQLDYSIKHNIGWLLESPEITKGSYNWIKTNYEKYEYVFTFDRELLELSDTFLMCPIGGCWIKPEQQKIYNKTKNISIIASAKRNTIGQRLRHEVISQVSGLDVYGRGYKPVENKLEALKDYRYSIIIENIKKDYYFTEKLIDSFMTGTIPVYYGCPSISEFFDMRGMIIINSVDDLKKNMFELTEEKYNSMKKYIDINFEKAKQYLISEDNIYKILKNKNLI